MNKLSQHQIIVLELKRYYRQAIEFYNKANLGDRFRRLPDFVNNTYENEEPAGDYIRQQAVDPAFRKAWLRRVGKTAEKMRAISIDDYNYAKKIINTKHFKDKGEEPTVAAHFEYEIDNLENVINWYSKKYLGDTKNSIEFNRKTSKLTRGDELLADFSVGKRKNGNPHKLLDVLFKNKASKIRQEQINIDTSSDTRAIDQALHAINKVAGCRLVLKQHSRYSQISKFYLNKEFIK